MCLISFNFITMVPTFVFISIFTGILMSSFESQTRNSPLFFNRGTPSEETGSTFRQSKLPADTFMDSFPVIFTLTSLIFFSLADKK